MCCHSLCKFKCVSVLLSLDSVPLESSQHWEGEVDTSPTPNPGAICVGVLEGKNQFSPVGCFWVYHNTRRQVNIKQSPWSLGFFERVFFVYFWWVFFVLSFLLNFIWFSFFVLFLERIREGGRSGKEHKVGYVGVRWIWRKGKHDQNTSSWKLNKKIVRNIWAVELCLPNTAF